MSLLPPPTGLPETTPEEENLPLAEHALLVRISGDVSTKASGTRERFCRRLAANLGIALTAAGIPHHLRREHLRLFVETEDPRAADVARRVFGVQSVSPTTVRPWSSRDDVVEAGYELLRDHVKDRTFAVRVRRIGNASIPFRSNEVERELGTRLLPHTKGVDLTHPGAIAHIEIHEHHAYYFQDKIPGYGGLPVGIEGRALSLISGGYDSAVASWLLLKRGVALDYAFFNLGGAAHRRGVLTVAGHLATHWSAGDRPTLHEIDFAPLVGALRNTVEPGYWQLVLKRRMLQAAARLAAELKLPALVTGEALGQVSSQTLVNLSVLSKDLDAPVLRPLLGFNKEEIIRVAEDIGTAPASAAVLEYCALLPRHPETRATHDLLREEDAKLDPGLLDAAFDARQTYDLLDLPRALLEEPGPAIDRVEPGMTVLDLRSRDDYRRGHHPGALHLDYAQALLSYPAFDRSLTYVLVCDLGLKSAHLADVMREAGFAAFRLRASESRL